MRIFSCVSSIELSNPRNLILLHYLSYNFVDLSHIPILSIAPVISFVAFSYSVIGPALGPSIAFDAMFPSSPWIWGSSSALPLSSIMLTFWKVEANCFISIVNLGGSEVSPWLAWDYTFLAGIETSIGTISEYHIQRPLMSVCPWLVLWILMTSLSWCPFLQYIATISPFLISILWGDTLK